MLEYMTSVGTNGPPDGGPFTWSRFGGTSLNFDIARIVMTLVVLIPSLAMHEFCHALAASALGDLTPQWQGRLTLNPLAHLDPFGTIMILTSLFAGRGLGWGKPVVVDPAQLKNPVRDMTLVAAAGPASNLSLALILGLSLRFFGSGMSDGLWLLLSVGTSLNIGLALFNLLPIPPLDGSRLARYFLRGAAYNTYRGFEQYGMFVLFALSMTGLFGILIGIPSDFLFELIVGV